MLEELESLIGPVKNFIGELETPRSKENKIESMEQVGLIINKILKSKAFKYAVLIMLIWILIRIIKNWLWFMATRTKLRTINKDKQSLVDVPDDKPFIDLPDKGEYIIDIKSSRAFARARRRFIKHPHKYSPTGIKYPPKVRRYIKRYMKTHGGALPPHIQQQWEALLYESTE